MLYCRYMRILISHEQWLTDRPTFVETKYSSANSNLIILTAAQYPNLFFVLTGHSSIIRQVGSGRDAVTIPRASKYLVLESPLGAATNEISNSFTTIAATTLAATMTTSVTMVYSSTQAATMSAKQAKQQPQQQQQQQNYPSLDKVVKAKLVSNDMSVSDSVDENLLELYNTPMYFGTENSTVVTVQAGAVAHLPCTIHHIGEGVVSNIF